MTAFSATDNFNRADASSLGSNWSTILGDTTCKIVSNTARNAATTGAAYPVWSGGSYDAQVNSYSECIVPSPTSNNRGPLVRINSSRSGYVYIVGTKKITKFTNGTQTVLATLTDTPSGTAVYKLEAIGSTLNVYKDGVLLGSAVDSTYSSGYVGIYLSAGITYGVDDWAGGTVVIEYTLTASNASVINSASSDSVIQTHILSGQSCDNAQSCQIGIVIQEIELAAANSSQVNFALTGQIVTVNGLLLIGQDAINVNQCNVGLVVQEHNLLADNSIQVNDCSSDAVKKILLAEDSVQVNQSSDSFIVQEITLSTTNSIQVNICISKRIFNTFGIWIESPPIENTWN